MKVSLAKPVQKGKLQKKISKPTSKEIIKQKQSSQGEFFSLLLSLSLSFPLGEIYFLICQIAEMYFQVIKGSGKIRASR